MTAGRHPSGAPQRPVEGGRGSFGVHARAMRHLEARAASERRQDGEYAVSDIPSLTTESPLDDIHVDGRLRSLASRLRASLEMALHRPRRSSRQ